VFVLHNVFAELFSIGSLLYWYINAFLFVQLQNIVEFLQTFVYLFLDPENALQRSTPYRLCQHMVLQPDCPFVASMLQSQSCTTIASGNNASRARFLCPTAEELKYKFVRLTIDCIDLYLVESGSALNIQVCRCI